MDTVLKIQNLSKSFDNEKTSVISDLSFSVKTGEILAIVGESGCGKTTLTRLICGLETPDTGTIKINDKIVSSDTVFVAPEKRSIGLVFQDYALFPHLTVSQNISYGISKSVEKNKRVKEVLNLIGLTGFENRYPHQLSGGQQQRVALARALAPNPKLVIFDEPFSNLDGILRQQLRNDIFKIINDTGITAIFVTHDTQDALTMANKIMILKEGKKIQKGSAKKLFKKPKNSYAASLFSDTIMLDKEDLEYFGFTFDSQNESKTFAIRVNHFIANSKSKYSIELNINNSIFIGESYIHNAQLPNKKVISFISKEKLPSLVRVGFNKKNVLCFD